MNQSSHESESTTANPAPPGLLAVGMTVILLNMQNIGLFDLNTMLLSMSIFCGGIAQIIIGIMEWKRENTFGTTAFLGYGFFWLSLPGLLLLQEINPTIAPGSLAMASYFSIWGIFTVIIFIASLRLNRAMQFIFASLILLFFLSAIGDVTGSTIIRQIAGSIGIICGLSAIYTGAAELLNDVYGKIVVPVWPVHK